MRLAWYSQRSVDDGLDLVHNVMLREQVIGVPAQWNIIIAVIWDWDLLGSLGAYLVAGSPGKYIVARQNRQNIVLGGGPGASIMMQKNLLKKK